MDAQSGQINAALLVNPQRHNVYAYSLNNPYRYVDSDGLWAEAVLFEIPSIAVGAHSLVDNIKQGNWSAAVVDAGGVAVDVVAAEIPGVPGGVGLSVKATRAMNVARKAISPVFKTTKEAAVVAKKLGFYKIKQSVHGGEAVFKRGKLYITRDIDGHHGGAWKMAKSIEDLGSKKTRDGTYNIDLTKRIGG